MTTVAAVNKVILMDFCLLCRQLILPSHSAVERQLIKKNTSSGFICELIIIHDMYVNGIKEAISSHGGT
jgi:hypothetical protein